MFNHFARVSCPKCEWKPRAKDTWKCPRCRHSWNVFDSHARCPRCGWNHHITTCPSCKESTAHAEWYADWRDIENEVCA